MTSKISVPGQGVILEAHHLRNLAAFAARFGALGAGVAGWGLLGPQDGAPHANQIRACERSIKFRSLRVLTREGLVIQDRGTIEIQRRADPQTLYEAEIDLPTPVAGTDGAQRLELRIVPKDRPATGIGRVALFRLGADPQCAVTWEAPALHPLGCEQTARASEELAASLARAHQVLCTDDPGRVAERDAVGRAKRWIARSRTGERMINLDTLRDVLETSFDVLLTKTEQREGRAESAGARAVREQILACPDATATELARYWSVLADSLDGPNGILKNLGVNRHACPQIGRAQIIGPGWRIERFEVEPERTVTLDAVMEGSGVPEIGARSIEDGQWETVLLTVPAPGRAEGRPANAPPGAWIEVLVPRGTKVRLFQ